MGDSRNPFAFAPETAGFAAESLRDLIDIQCAVCDGHVEIGDRPTDRSKDTHRGQVDTLHGV